MIFLLKFYIKRWLEEGDTEIYVEGERERQRWNMRRDCDSHGESEMKRDRERQSKKVRDRKRLIEGDIEGERNR